MELKFDKEIMEVLTKLKENGKAYIIGGYIRDKLLNVRSSDVDMITDIEQSRLLEILKEYRPTIYNDKYQIVKFRTKKHKYEIARLREDIGSLDGRNPYKFNFVTDILKDIKRRDFTINAIAYDGEKIIDFLGGLSDLKQQRIRVIGDANKRLLEDRIRIMRAFRFMAKLNLDFEENLELIIKNLAKDEKLFENLSKDRLLIEFNEVISQKHSYKALKKMYDLNILKHFIQEYDNEKYSSEVFYKICRMYKTMLLKYKVIDDEMAYALLFSFSAKKKEDFLEKNYEMDSVNIFNKFSAKYRIRKKEAINIANLIYYHNIIHKNPSLIMLKRMLLDLVNNNMVCKLLNMTKIMYQWKFENDTINKILYNIQRLYLLKEPVFLLDLDLINMDLYNLNINPKRFLEIKKNVFKDVLSGSLENSKDAILKNIIEKNKLDIDLKEEFCAGAVVYRKINKTYEFLIIKGAKGSYGFSKGHIEKNERAIDTAIREVKEETNIDISLIDTKHFVHYLKYVISPDIYKEVSIYLAKAKTHNIDIDRLELDDARWVDFKEALSLLTYSYQRNILKKAMLYIYEDER